MQHYVILGTSPYGLPLDQELLPEKLKSLGYSTHMIGKWHQGHFAVDYLPTRSKDRLVFVSLHSSWVIP